MTAPPLSYLVRGKDGGLAGYSSWVGLIPQLRLSAAVLLNGPARTLGDVIAATFADVVPALVDGARAEASVAPRARRAVLLFPLQRCSRSSRGLTPAHTPRTSLGTTDAASFGGSEALSTARLHMRRRRRCALTRS